MGGSGSGTRDFGRKPGGTTSRGSGEGGGLKIENGIVFGLLEDHLPATSGTNVTVSAKQIVYDPQSDSKAIPWSLTGSNADRLAICANIAEMEAMVEVLQLEYDN